MAQLKKLKPFANSPPLTLRHSTMGTHQCFHHLRLYNIKIELKLNKNRNRIF